MKRLYVVVLALVLSGCGGDPPPVAPASPSASPSASVAAAPVLPEEAKEDSKEGAVAFVKYYFDLVNRAQATGDTRWLKRVEDPECVSCNSGRDFLDAIYTHGGRIVGGDIDVRVLSSLRNRSLPGWTIDCSLSFGPQTVVRPWRSEPNETLKGGQTVATFFVSRKDNSWVVANWSRVR